MRKLLFSWLFMWSVLSFSFHQPEGFGSQQSLLLHLKNTLVFDRALSTKLVMWNNTLDCCSWEGLFCDDKGRVTGLDISDEGIYGGLDDSSSLFDLKHLKKLDLSFNNFDSRIPSRIGSLRNLSYLNLSKASFGGQIPSEMSKLSRLVALDISTWLPNSMKLEIADLGELIKNMSKLEELYLDGVSISASSGSEWCWDLSSSVLNLRVLSLNNCNLSGPIDSSFEKLHSLSVIRLRYNKLSTSVPEFFSKFSSLTTLDLSNCELYGTFPKEVFLIPTLQVVILSGNGLLEVSFPPFPQRSAIQTLDVSYTNFSGIIPTSIGNLRNLARLGLSNCSCGGTLLSLVEELTQLIHVDLSSNKLIGSVPSFKMSKNLTRIYLSFNSLSGAIPSAHWQVLDKLVELDLSNNLLTGTIPSSIFALPALERLDLSYNRFGGQLPDFKNVSSSRLFSLNLDSNNLEGPIPSSIEKLGSLSMLSLSSNKLNGTIQRHYFLASHNLTVLDLSYNNLTNEASRNDSIWLSSSKIARLNLASCKLTTFPNLRNQSMLHSLDLSDNQIHEEIPSWIWELGNGSLSSLNLSHNNLVGMLIIRASVSVLDLHSNQLSGNLPALPRAYYIDLSSNNFTSGIPTDIGYHLNFTLYFLISNNKLTGSIPESICYASSLQVLDLSNNSLSGILPECLFATIPTLGVLNLRGNNFRGKIPDLFTDDCSLQTLDLNGNSIDGKIPKSFATCTELEVLDLGNNMLTGKFPCFLENIPALRVLVMRSNRFQGSIGCHNSTGAWAKLQIIDLAHNKFSGEIQGEFVTRWKAMKNEQKMSNLYFIFKDYSSSNYYQDSVTVTVKGQEMKLQKILTLFTSVDLSSNNFSGPMPQELGELQALHILNISHNSLTGEMPASIGNLRELESLDLSSNFLNGEIPQSLTSLNFLQLMNLSFNRLVGKVPTGNQFQTFSAESYAGNEGLCSFPLPTECTNPNKSANNLERTDASGTDWNIISSEVGFFVGFGSIIGPLIFCRRFRTWYYLRADDIAFRMFPRIYGRFM